jgi:CheY-like chemotaxis protein
MDNQYRILVVDDDPVNLEILDKQLKKTGYSVDLAQDGVEAWAMLEKNPEKYDTILLDRMMPGMNGMEVLAKIKKHDLLKIVPVIMQTAKAASEEVIEGLQGGAYYYLTKPFFKAALLGIVKAALDDYAKYRLLREKANKTVGSFSLMNKGLYSFHTLEEADTLATIVVNICPVPEKVTLGLSELLINAVEHGNLGLTYEDKSRINEEGQWFLEIEQRLALPDYGSKRATLEVVRAESEIRFSITDEGEGFKWEQYLEISPERAFDTHGRGIAVSNAMSFNRLEYTGKGNKVLAVVNL